MTYLWILLHRKQWTDRRCNIAEHYTCMHLCKFHGLWEVNSNSWSKHIKSFFCNWENKVSKYKRYPCSYWYVYVYKKTCQRFALQCSWQLMLSMIRQIAPICIWCTHLFNDLTYLELPLSIVNFLWNSLEFVFC